MNRIVQHVVGEIALALVGAPGGVAALKVAVLAAGDIFGTAGRDIVGAAECVVVPAERGGRDLAALRARGQDKRDKGNREESA